MISVSKSSLIEQKKQQWAREREEMSHLYLPWGSGERYNRLPIRNQFASSLELHKQSSYEYQEPQARQRSPSLPPIGNSEQKQDANIPKSLEVINRNVTSSRRFSYYDEDGEGDTSGYGSETVNHKCLNEGLVTGISQHQVMAWQQNSANIRSGPASSGHNNIPEDATWPNRSPRSAEDGRLKWGDRGVATGRLWEPTTPNSRLPQMQSQKKGTPSWVERGLNMIGNSSEVLVIDQRSSTNSGFDCDRSSSNGSEEGRSFLRGQNVPVEPEIKAQRENQRIKALEIQSVILSQLEDRERRKQEEKERKLQEDRMEELRLQRQQEEDRQRLEEERRKVQEKQLLEQRKLETLQKALEDAEIKAKLEKERKFSNYKQRNQYSNDNLLSNEEMKTEDNSKLPEQDEVIKSHRSLDVQSARSLTQKIDQIISQHTTALNSPRSMSHRNVNFLLNNPATPPISIMDSQYSIVPIGGNGESVKGIQLAVLVPQNINNSMLSLSLNSLNNTNETDMEKILTPRKYRSLSNKDASTQTEEKHFKASVNVKNYRTEVHMDTNIDENAPQDSNHLSKKERRFRSEERYKKDIDTRPKWGVNRPTAQYKKQSEKDPFYSQKRKIRHKYRTQLRQYVSQSSDDSRSPSPSRSDKLNDSNNLRNSLTQSYWRKKRTSHDYSQQISFNDLSPNNSICQTDSMTNRINESTFISDPKKSPNNENKSPTKRITLSQKFINDKYGNRRLWNDDEISIKNNGYDVENRKRYIDQMNRIKRDQLDNNEDLDVVVN